MQQPEAFAALLSLWILPSRGYVSTCVVRCILWPLAFAVLNLASASGLLRWTIAQLDCRLLLGTCDVPWHFPLLKRPAVGAPRVYLANSMPVLLRRLQLQADISLSHVVVPCHVRIWQPAESQSWGHVGSIQTSSSVSRPASPPAALADGPVLACRLPGGGLKDSWLLWCPALPGARLTQSARLTSILSRGWISTP